LTVSGRVAAGPSRAARRIRRIVGRPLPRAWLPAAATLLAFALAFIQRPGETVFDSRIELTVDVGLFMDRVKDVWSPTADLGHAQSGQFVGYLFPMGPWYAGWDATGLPIWIGQRLWLGALLALAAVGVIRLMDALHDPRRGISTAYAAAVYMLAPYVAVFVSGSSVTLLAYAALPWLLLAAHRGPRTPRGWRWPAVSALLIAAAGGGVNAAVALWVVLGGLLLLAYEVAVLRWPGRAALSFLWRAAVCGFMASAWWLVPVLLQGIHGEDFIGFTEGPETIWATTSLSESVRGLGYWLLYLAVGGEPVRSISATYLFEPVVVAATFLVPLLAVAGFRWSRRWAYGPFFALVAGGALLVMAAGFPEGAPMRKLLSAVYYESESLRFLRTTYKAAPLLALSVACLGGVALAALTARAHTRRLQRPDARLAHVWPVAAAVALPVLAGLPLVTGKAIEREYAYGDIPGYWRSAVADSERSTPSGKRVMVLPGALFAWYRWGYTVNGVAPAMTHHPVLQREVVRYAPPRASQLQAEVDDLIQQARLVPGQLDPLLELLGVGEVLVQSDYRPAPSGALDRASLSEALSDQPGFSDPVENYGTVRTYVPAPGRGGRPQRVPDIRRFATPGEGGAGIVRLHPWAGAVVLDGDAEGITNLAAVGRLNTRRALFYAGDLDRDRLAQLAGDGATLVFTDSHRRRVLESNQLRANRGPTVGAGDRLPREWPSYDLFPERGTSAQTVARYTGLEYLRAPLFRSFAVYPEHRPYAALDGDPETSWLASETTFEPKRQRWMELAFRRPRQVPSIRVLPQRDSAGLTDELAVSVNGGSERHVDLHAGWNTVPIDAGDVRRLRLRVLGTDGFGDRPGGIAELDVPGLEVREALRLPTLLPRLAAGLPLSASPMLVLLRRTTADFPFRAGNDVGDESAGSQIDMVDAERGLVRDVTLPARRGFHIRGLASVDPAAPDQRIDRLAGAQLGWRFSSSGRFEGVPRHRASSAFDGDPATAWVGNAVPGSFPWFGWRSPLRHTVRELRLAPGPPEYSFPRRVRIVGANGFAVSRDVPRSGRVLLPRPVRTRGLRIFVVEGRVSRRPRRALRAVAVGEVTVPGLRPPRPRRSGPLRGRCGDIVLRAGGQRRTARLSGSVRDLNAGRPLRIRGCGGPMPLHRGATRLTAPPGRVARLDYLALIAPAPRPRGATPSSSSRVLSPGSSPLGGRREDVRLDIAEPSWLVLAESYSRGWTAWCFGPDGHERPLGAPTPIDGYANGWPVDGRCERARFAFRPQRLADLSYVISGAAALTLLLLALLTPGGRGMTAARDIAATLRPDDPVRRLRLPYALLAGVVVGVAGGLLFALRAGAVLAPLTVALALLGVTVRRMAALGALALVAALVLYLVHPAEELAGFTFRYPLHHIAGHWAVALCVSCLAVAGAMAARALRAAGARRP
jgi:arabinofuranan 3-O-arabinosyltransferase